jgi:hypothetical protein
MYRNGLSSPHAAGAPRTSRTAGGGDDINNGGGTGAAIVAAAGASDMENASKRLVMRFFISILPPNIWMPPKPCFRNKRSDFYVQFLRSSAFKP